MLLSCRLKESFLNLFRLFQRRSHTNQKTIKLWGLKWILQNVAQAFSKLIYKSIRLSTQNKRIPTFGVHQHLNVQLGMHKTWNQDCCAPCHWSTTNSKTKISEHCSACKSNRILKRCRLAPKCTSEMHLVTQWNFWSFFVIGQVLQNMYRVPTRYILCSVGCGTRWHSLSLPWRHGKSFSLNFNQLRWAEVIAKDNPASVSVDDTGQDNNTAMLSTECFKRLATDTQFALRRSKPCMPTATIKSSCAHAQTGHSSPRVTKISSDRAINNNCWNKTEQWKSPFWIRQLD